MFEKREYPELAGKEVKYVSHDGTKERVGVVVACDYYVGYTVVEKDDHEHFLKCGLGPMAPNGKRCYTRGKDDVEEWDLLFENFISEVSNGVIYSASARRALDLNSMPASRCTNRPLTVKSCPFSQ